MFEVALTSAVGKGFSRPLGQMNCVWFVGWPEKSGDRPPTRYTTHRLTRFQVHPRCECSRLFHTSAWLSRIFLPVCRRACRPGRRLSNISGETEPAEIDQNLPSFAHSTPIRAEGREKAKWRTADEVPKMFVAKRSHLSSSAVLVIRVPSQGGTRAPVPVKCRATNT